MLVNIGYRKYAKHFEIFGAEVMSDNSDIPDASTVAQGELEKCR